MTQTTSKDYDAPNWYWQLGGDQSRVWSVAQCQYVDIADIADWQADGGVPAYIDDEAALDRHLGSMGLGGPLFTATDRLIASYRAAIQSHVDATAQGRKYDGGNSLASYVASTNEQWASEAQVFVAWRDAVWTYAYAELDQVETGARSVPESVAAFIAELPVIEWTAV